jgi:serine/threonine protein kinase
MAISQRLCRVGRRYQLRGALGKGGMGAVYVAPDRLKLEMVALKRVVLPTFDDVDPMMAALPADLDPALALAREFQALTSLRHPNIIAVKDYGFDRTDGQAKPQPFFTMELLASPESIREPLLKGKLSTLLRRAKRVPRLPHSARVQGDVSVKCGWQTAHADGSTFASA